MTILDRIRTPADLKNLDDAELETLAEEIRDFLVEHVAQTGGHLGPNLGVVELTIALHRVFDSPTDKIVFDTGHQAYVHKILTGRADRFDTLRKRGGISGYPNRRESPHDIVENSHASTSLSYADGLAKAALIKGDEHTVVAVIGDGALTGGMAWEALNAIAASKQSRLVIVVNDNGRSYTDTVGGLAEHLATIRTDPRYEQLLDQVKTRLNRTKVVGPPVYDALHAIKKGLKDALAPQGMFEDLKLKYVGPVDGHDIGSLENALAHAKNFKAPVIVHALTRKGNGYLPAERHTADNFHSPGAFDPATGELLAKPATIWTDIFRDEIVAIGSRRRDVVAITAAMLHPTGLDAFQAAYPDRTFDVGIAEQHALTSAAGMAMAGLHPVVAVYATFLNRAFDQVLMDVGLHECGVTIVLDRAGVTGEDGPSHNGMWDLSILQVVPRLKIAAPRDGTRLRELLREAVAINEVPTVVRFPRGAVSPDVEAVRSMGAVDVMVREGDQDVLLIGVGPMVATCIGVAQRLRDQGIGVTVIDPRWVKPLPMELTQLAAAHRLVVSVEDNGRVGGFGSVLGQNLRDAAVDVAMHVFAIPQRFLVHGTRTEILQSIGLDVTTIAREVTSRIAAINAAEEQRDRGTGRAAFTQLP